MDDNINLEQFLKISNYEDTVRQLDIYYGIGTVRKSRFIEDVADLLCF